MRFKLVYVVMTDGFRGPLKPITGHIQRKTNTKGNRRLKAYLFYILMHNWLFSCYRYIK